MVSFEVPDTIAHALTDDNRLDLASRVREFLAVDGYRRERLTQKQVGEFLGLSRIETEDFLAGHLDLYDYDPDDLIREALYFKELY